MEHSGVKCFHCNHVFDLTNLKGEKRRNIGKQNNELNIINQLAKFYDLPVSNWAPIKCETKRNETK